MAPQFKKYPEKSEYSKKLLDPRWQKKRLEILSRDEFKCQSCGDETNTLHVHHRMYIQGREPWEYDDKQLITLCWVCHEEETEALQTMKDDLMTSFQNAGFLAKHLGPIVTSIIDLDTSIHLPEVIASAIGYAFSQPGSTQRFLSEYFEYLNNNGEPFSE